jgi:hypothetical protein
MSAIVVDESIHSLNIVKEIEIAASAEIVFESVLEELGPGGEMPGGAPFPMVIEPWPGGRWYRDLGNKAGHYWGTVQVIKPPQLIELCGPMFMSYPAISHLQYRLTSVSAGTKLVLTHRAIGQIPADHRKGVQEGWEHALKTIKKIALKRAG